MEKVEFTIKRISLMNMKDNKFPCYFILDEENNLYQYVIQGNYHQPTRMYLELAKPGDVLECAFGIIDVHEAGKKIEIKNLSWAHIKETVSSK